MLRFTKIFAVAAVITTLVGNAASAGSTQMSLGTWGLSDHPTPTYVELGAGYIQPEITYQAIDKTPYISFENIDTQDQQEAGWLRAAQIEPTFAKEALFKSDLGQPFGGVYRQIEPTFGSQMN